LVRARALRSLLKPPPVKLVPTINSATHTQETSRGTVAGVGPGEKGLSQGMAISAVAAIVSL
jgi:hypothetical protein